MSIIRKPVLITILLCVFGACDGFNPPSSLAPTAPSVLIAVPSVVTTTAALPTPTLDVSNAPPSTATVLPTETPALTPPPPAPPTKSPPPSRPAQFAEYPQAILNFLNANPRNWSAWEQLLKSWDALKAITQRSAYSGGPDNLAAVDVDGDGQEDMLLAVTDPDALFPERGMLLVYLRQNSTYRLAQQIGDARNGYPSRPTIFVAGDLLKDGRIEIVLTTTNCGAHTCFTFVDVLRWDGQQLRSLISPHREMANAEINLQPSGHGTLDLVLHGGIISSVGAGPQRAITEIYRWNGTAFTLAQTAVAPSNYLYFKVVDANALMLGKRYVDAIALYQEAITNPKLAAYGIPGEDVERADLHAFARFRLMVAYALLNDATHAQVARDDLLTQQPNHIYAQVAKLFWQAYLPQRRVAAGCSAVTTFARAHAEVADVLNHFGYANPAISANDVCPFR